MTGSSAWMPCGAVRWDGLPAVGWFVARGHAVWRVREVTGLPGTGVVELPGALTHEVALTPVAGVAAGCPEGGSLVVAVHGYSWWWLYPQGRFPVCVCCGGPPPCPRESARARARAEAQWAWRFDTPRVCPACRLPVEAGHEAVVFAENVEVPSGPPVSFHAGPLRCRAAAQAYGRRCSAPPRRAGRHPAGPCAPPDTGGGPGRV